MSTWFAMPLVLMIGLRSATAAADEPPMKVAAAINQFTVDIYRAIAGDEGNLFCSPYSVSSALAMVYAGARGDTEREMAAALHFESQETHAALGDLQRRFAEYEKTREGQQPFQLKVSNALWIQTGYALQQAYLDLLKQRYDAAPQLLDFAASAEKAAGTINEWVKERTGGKIERLIDPGVLSAGAKLVLTNVVYFKANWQNPFKKGMTADGPFHLPDGKTVQTPMMTQTESMLYAENADCQTVELEYSVPNMRFTILLPKRGVAALEKSLSGEAVGRLLDGLKPQDVALWLPRFTMRSGFELADALERLGMKHAFTDQADFSGITGGRDLKIAKVIHKTFVNVDEEGTEAAAATAVMMTPTGIAVRPQVKEIRVDRPFLFLIRDAKTGVILFLGRVDDPRESN
jgi:serpin B